MPSRHILQACVLSLSSCINSRVYRPAGGDRPQPGCLNSPAGSQRPAQHTPLAPKRDDVPPLDPCNWQLSAGAEVDLCIKGRQKVIGFQHVASAMLVSPHYKEKVKTASRLSAIELRHDQAWNSRRISHAAIRARLADICRSYEDVDWDSKLPRRQKATPTLEKIADPVAERPSSIRYYRKPQLWQSGRETVTNNRGDWGAPGHVVSCGTIGSENMDNIDNMEEDFQPLTLKRSIVPPYTPPARCP
uniref:uncharacterized protein LOC131108296 n=1 Tax=Doryrhamphus excisus TaxID=161450 RepID=UPI0025AE44B6|nr:uncharacterized protein LOC131108296 [Doryrhamphus excisus]